MFSLQGSILALLGSSSGRLGRTNSLYFPGPKNMMDPGQNFDAPNQGKKLEWTILEPESENKTKNKFESRGPFSYNTFLCNGVHTALLTWHLPKWRCPGDSSHPGWGHPGRATWADAMAVMLYTPHCKEKNCRMQHWHKMGSKRKTSGFRPRTTHQAEVVGSVKEER